MLKNGPENEVTRKFEGCVRFIDRWAEKFSSTNDYICLDLPNQRLKSDIYKALKELSKILDEMKMVISFNDSNLGYI